MREQIKSIAIQHCSWKESSRVSTMLMSHAASDGAHDKKVHSKSELQFTHELPVTGNPQTQSLSFWGGKWGRARKMYSSWTKLPGFSCRELKHFTDWQKAQELVLESQQNRLNIVGISSTKRRKFGTIELNAGWKISYSGFDAAMSAQAAVGLHVSWVSRCRDAIGRKTLSCFSLCLTFEL